MMCNRAFTLLELAIVLIIIGMVLGGITVGQNFIRSSALKTITVDVTRYIGAVKQFQEKFRSLPGDMPNATNFWGDQDATPATCAITASTTELTCNGNGDSRIGRRLNFAPLGLGLAMDSIDTQAFEKFRFWQQLKNAGFIEGNFTGIAGDPGIEDHRAILGINVPASELEGGGFSVMYLGDWPLNIVTPDHNFWEGRWGHLLVFGTAENAAGTMGALVSAKETEEMDRKIDDGLPASGKLSVPKQAAPLPGNVYGSNCSTEGTFMTASYNTAAADRHCILLFRGGF